MQTSGRPCRENADAYLLFEIRIKMSPRHCERNEAIHLAKQGMSGLLRRACHRAALRADPLARNDDFLPFRIPAQPIAASSTCFI